MTSEQIRDKAMRLLMREKTPLTLGYLGHCLTLASKALSRELNSDPLCRFGFWWEDDASKTRVYLLGINLPKERDRL